MVVRELVTILGFRTDMSSLRAAEVKIRQTGKRMQQVGRNLTMRVTLPIVALGVGILKAAGDFEFAMNRVKVLTGATGETFEKLKQQAKDLGRTTVFSASDAAEGMGFLAQAGFEANQIFAAMPATLNLAAAAQQDLAVTADQMSNIMQGFGIDASEAGRASDVIAYTAASANTNVSQFAEAMKYAAPLARLVGISLEEAAAMIGFMGNAGIQASMAGTTLRGAMARMLEITPKVDREFKRLGISLYKVDQNGRRMRKPLIEILTELEKLGLESDDLAASMTVIFGRRVIAGMAAILGQGTDALKEFTEEIGDKGVGSALKQSQIQMQGFRGAMKRLRSTAEASAIAIAESGFMDYVEELVRKFADFFEELAKTNPELLRMGTVAFLAVAAIGPLISMIGSLSIALASISAHPIILVLAALVALYGMYKLLKTETGKKWAYEKFTKPMNKELIRMRTGLRMKRLGYTDEQIEAMRKAGTSPIYQAERSAAEAGYWADVQALQLQEDMKLIAKGKSPKYGTMTPSGYKQEPLYSISIEQQNDVKVDIAEGLATAEVTKAVTSAMNETVQQITEEIQRNIPTRE